MLVNWERVYDNGFTQLDGTGLGSVSPTGMRFGEFNSLTEDQKPFAGIGRFEFSDNSTGVFSYEPSAYPASQWGHAEISVLPVSKLFGIPTANDGITASDETGAYP